MDSSFENEDSVIIIIIIIMSLFLLLNTKGDILNFVLCHKSQWLPKTIETFFKIPSLFFFTVLERDGKIVIFG